MLVTRRTDRLARRRAARRRGRGRAATVTDGAGRAVPVPAQGRARVSGRAAGRHHALYAGARAAARLAARQRAGGARVPAARHRRPARGRPHHRPRQHRQSRGRARAQARSHPRRRLRRARPMSRSPTACSSRPAFPMRCSTAASRAAAAAYRHARRADRPPRGRRGSRRATPKQTLRRSRGRIAGVPQGAAAARLLRARAARAGDRARRLDQRRDHRVPGAERRRRHPRRPRQCLDRAGAGVESRT